jgi:hypothetical protein
VLYSDKPFFSRYPTLDLARATAIQAGPFIQKIQARMATGKEREIKIEFRAKKASALFAPGLMECSLALTVGADFPDSDFHLSPAPPGRHSANVR